MNAVSLYLSTCRYVMQARTETPASWSDLYKYLPYLRQALACCVCTKILQVPVGPIDSICQHHICDCCRGGKMRLRPSCSWCKDHDVFIENTQLRIIVQCYKQLCCFLSSLNLPETLADVENGDKNSLLKIISEGAGINDSFSYNANPLSTSAMSLTPMKTGDAHTNGSAGPESPPPVRSTTPVGRGKSKQRGKRASSLKETTTVSQISVSKQDQVTQTDNQGHSAERDYHHQDDLDDTNIDEIRQRSAHLGHSRDDTGENAPQRSKTNKAPHLGEHDYMKGPLCYSVVMPNGDEPKLTIRRRPTVQLTNISKKRRLDRSFHHTEAHMNNISVPRPRKHKTKDGKRKGCRCGMATPTPGKLTCCGQRCPCYTAWKPCVDCICRGCHNPRREPPPMLSEASVIAEEVEISVI